MSSLGNRAELLKLARALGVPVDGLAYLGRVPAIELQALRAAIIERHHRQALPRILLVTGLAHLLPPWLSAWLGQWLLGAPLVAGMAGQLPARQAAAIAARLSVPFMAQVAPWLDPRTARDLIRRLPVERIVDIAMELLARRDYMTLGRFASFLPDDAIVAVIGHIDNDEHLMRIAFYVESRGRLDHIVRILPRERLRRAILLAIYPEKDVLTEIMSLVVHVSYGLQRELGDLAAEQEEAVLARVIHATQAEGYWADILPVLANVSVESQRKVVNLPILRDEPEVMEQVLQTVAAENLWLCMLPLFPLMSPEMRRLVADVASGFPRRVTEEACAAALVGEYWDILVDVAAMMPAAKHQEYAEVIDYYGRTDPELRERIKRRAESRGIVWPGDAMPLLTSAIA